MQHRSRDEHEPWAQGVLFLFSSYDNEEQRAISQRVAQRNSDSSRVISSEHLTARDRFSKLDLLLLNTE